MACEDKKNGSVEIALFGQAQGREWKNEEKMVVVDEAELISTIFMLYCFTLHCDR